VAFVVLRAAHRRHRVDRLVLLQGDAAAQPVRPQPLPAEVSPHSRGRSLHRARTDRAAGAAPPRGEN
jgi:hypothetical protein